jgi:DNA polymerase III delta subunit
MSISASALSALRSSLSSSLIITPRDEGYTDAIRRWSDTGIKQAVLNSLLLLITKLKTNKHREWLSNQQQNPTSSQP